METLATIALYCLLGSAMIGMFIHAITLAHKHRRDGKSTEKGLKFEVFMDKFLPRLDVIFTIIFALFLIISGVLLFLT